MADTSYVPGVCNINPKETASRRNAGRFGLALYVILLIALLFSHLSRLYRLTLLIPAFIAAIGYLQAKNNFCVAYAGSGMENATEGSLKASKINDSQSVAKDKKKASEIYLQSVIVALALTVVGLLIPSL